MQDTILRIVPMIDGVAPLELTLDEISFSDVRAHSIANGFLFELYYANDIATLQIFESDNDAGETYSNSTPVAELIFSCY